MQKVRVYQLAKELRVQSALILELLDRLGQDVKSDLSVLDMDTADLVRERVTTALEAEKKRLAEEREREKVLAEAEAQLQAEQELARVAAKKPAEEAEEPAEEVPLAAEPAAEEVPAASPPAPAPAKPAAPPPAAPTPVAARAAGAAGPTPVLGVRKPRVFPARRIPTCSLSY